MLMTILEARVTSERWGKLASIYHKGIKKLPVALLQTFLVQDSKDPNIWRIVSEWRSKQEYEHSNEPQEHDAHCMEMFRAVGVEPTCRIFEVRAHHEHV